MSTTTNLSTKPGYKQREIDWGKQAGKETALKTKVRGSVSSDVQWKRSGDIKWGDCRVMTNMWWLFSTANLHQGGRHGSLPSHAVANEDALLDAQLGEEVFQIIGHRFIGQRWAVWAVAMVTGIYSQHLTGQRTVRIFGMGGKRQQDGNIKNAINCIYFSFFGSSSGEWQHKQRLDCAHEVMNFVEQAKEQIICQYS